MEPVGSRWRKKRPRRNQERGGKGKRRSCGRERKDIEGGGGGGEGDAREEGER